MGAAEARRLTTVKGRDATSASFPFTVCVPRQSLTSTFASLRSVSRICSIAAFWLSETA